MTNAAKQPARKKITPVALKKPAAPKAAAAKQPGAVVRKTIVQSAPDAHQKHTAALLGAIPGKSSAWESDKSKQEEVTVTVPKTFKLRKADHSEITIPAGIQQMPRWVAEHWWSKRNGVEIYNPK